MKFKRFILPGGCHTFYQEGDTEAYKELVRLTKKIAPSKESDDLSEEALKIFNWK